MSDPLSFEADEPEVAAAPAEPASFEVDPPSFELDAPEAIPEVAAAPLHETTATLNVDAPVQNAPVEPGLAAYPEAQVPLQPLFDVAQKFKKQHIDPIVRGAQFWGKLQYNMMGGGKLREKSPALALGAESLARPYIGETELNQPGSQHPEALKALNAAESSIDQVLPGWGAGITAAYQSGAQNLGNLPFYLIPGIGSNAMVAGLTGNVASALLEPDADLKDAAVMGMIGGKAAEVAVKGAAKGFKAAQGLLGKRGAKTTVPVAVVPADELDALARQVTDEIPTEELAPRAKADTTQASAYVTDIQDGVPVTKSLKITPETVTSRLLPEGSSPPKGATVIMTPEAQAVMSNNPVSTMAHDFWQPGSVIDERSIMDLQDWDASRPSGVSEGHVLAIEGGGGDGTARLHEVNSPALQREILKTRGLVEITLPTGEKQLGFVSPGETYGGLIRPDADEFIPNAIPEDFLFSKQRWEHLVNPDAPGPKTTRYITSNSELDDILLQRERLRSDALEGEIRAKADAEVSAADLALGGDGSGNGLPPPPGHLPPDAPPPPPNPKRDALDPTTNVAQQWWASAAKMGEKLKNKWLNPTVRGPQDLFDLSKMAHSVDSFEKLKAPIFEQLQAAAPELQKMTPMQHRQVADDISRFVTGHTTLEQLQAKQPMLSAAFYRQLEQRQIQQVADTKQLQNLGMLAPDQELTDVIGAEIADSPAFLNRLYMRQLLPPGEWKAIASRDKTGMAALRDSIMQDIYTFHPGKKGTEQYKTMSQETRRTMAERHLDFLLGDPEKLAQAQKDPSGAWKSVIKEAHGNLKANKDLRWWEKAALGEIDSPFLRIAESQARAKAMILRGSMWREVALNPKLAVHPSQMGPQHADWIELAARPNEFGKAAGMLVSPETYEALISAPLAQKNIASLTSKFVNAIKYGQTVGNPGSWVANFFANGQNAMLSNLVDPFASPVKIGKGMGTFFDDMAAHKAGIGKVAEEASSLPVQRFNRMMELGVVGSDFASHEFQESVRAWSRIIDEERAMTQGQINAHDMFVRLAKRAADGKQKITNLYSNIDAMWKYSTALAGLEKGGINLTTGQLDVGKAISFIDKRYRWRMTKEQLKEQVELEVAHRIHLSFPMVDRIGEIPAKMGQAAGVLFSPYVKMWAETGRNYAQLPQRVLMEKGMAAQMLKVSAIAGTLYAANKGMQQAMGMDQKEIDRAFATAPEAVRRFKPGAMALPFRTAEGRLTLIDLTRIFEPFTYLTGNPETAAPVRMLQNMVMNPVSGGLAEPLLAEMLSRAGLIDPVYRGPEVPEWRRDISGALVDTAGRVLPAVLRNTYNTLERGQVGFAPKGFYGQSPQPQSPVVTGANLLLGPNRLQEIGGKEEEARALFSREMAMRQAKKEAKQVGRMHEGQSTGPLTAPLDKAEALRKSREIATEKKQNYLKFRDSLKK